LDYAGLAAGEKPTAGGYRPPPAHIGASRISGNLVSVPSNRGWGLNSRIPPSLTGGIPDDRFLLANPEEYHILPRGLELIIQLAENGFSCPQRSDLRNQVSPEQLESRCPSCMGFSFVSSVLSSEFPVSVLGEMGWSLQNATEKASSPHLTRSSFCQGRSSRCNTCTRPRIHSAENPQRCGNGMVLQPHGLGSVF